MHLPPVSKPNNTPSYTKMIQRPTPSHSTHHNVWLVKSVYLIRAFPWDRRHSKGRQGIHIKRVVFIGVTSSGPDRDRLCEGVGRTGGDWPLRCCPSSTFRTTGHNGNAKLKGPGLNPYNGKLFWGGFYVFL